MSELDPTELVTAARSALSAINYIEKELRDLNAVLPELVPARRCLYALAGESTKLQDALLPYGPSADMVHPDDSEAQRKFIRTLDKAIEFHRTNQNDPHNIGNAVMAALHEVKVAAVEAYRADDVD